MRFAADIIFSEGFSFSDQISVFFRLLSEHRPETFSDRGSPDRGIGFLAPDESLRAKKETSGSSDLLNINLCFARCLLFRFRTNDLIMMMMMCTTIQYYLIRFVKRTFNMFQQLQECVLNATYFFGKLFVVV